MSKHLKKINIQAAAAYCGFDTQVIGHAARTGRLRGYKSGPFGPWYFTEEDLDDWVASMEHHTPARSERAEVSR